jgi:hypothetical protein
MVGMAADWAKAYNKLSRALEERRALLEAFGGMDLDLIQVANEEWLYMLQEDTRHSLGSSRDFCGFLFRGPKRAHVQVTPESPVLTVFP